MQFTDVFSTKLPEGKCIKISQSQRILQRRGWQRQALQNLSLGRNSVKSTSADGYAFFGGGRIGYASEMVANVDAYDDVQLVRHPADALSVARCHHCATAVGNYALFGGGRTSSGATKVVDAYTRSLTRSSAPALGVARLQLAATSIGNHAIFAGGGSSSSAAVDAYSSSLTKESILSLSARAYDVMATWNSRYAIIGGGSSTAVTAYNASLVQSIPQESLTYRSTGLQNTDLATSIGGYALFNSDGNFVEVYDSSLQKSFAKPLSAVTTSASSSTSTSEHAIFAGVSMDSGNRILNVYDPSLTTTLIQRRNLEGGTLSYGTATSLGRYLLFQYETTSSSDNRVEAFFYV